MKFILASLFLLLSLPVMGAPYISDNFASATGRWSTNAFWYGNEGVKWPNGGATTFANTFNAATGLRMNGYINDGQTDVNGSWIGRWITLLTKFSASKEKPVGIEVIRTFNQMGLVEALKDHHMGGLFLVEDNGIDINRALVTSRNTSQWQKSFPNFVGYQEFLSRSFIASRPYNYFHSRFVIIDKGLNYILNENDLTNKNLGPRFTSVNFISNTNAAGAWLKGHGMFKYANNETTRDFANANLLGFKAIHDGERIYFYMNPNPFKSNASAGYTYPNEYFLMGSVETTFTNNITFMLGGQSRRAENFAGAKIIDTIYRSLLVKNAVNRSELSIESSVTGNSGIPWSETEQTLTLLLSNTVHITNAGFNRIRIKPPTGFPLPANLLTKMKLYVSKNGGTETPLALINFEKTGTPSANQAWITNANGTIVIHLGTQLTNNIASTAVYNVRVEYLCTVTNNFNPGRFIVDVEALTLAGDTGAAMYRYSTCGPERAHGGDIFQALAPSRGFASISPTNIERNRDPYQFTVYLQSEENTRLKSIRSLAVRLPQNVSNLTISNIYSFHLGGGSSAISKTNLPGITNGNFFTINYNASPIAAGGGLDVITFSLLGTATNTNSSYNWEMWVSGDFTNYSKVTTNNIYRGKSLKIVPENPFNPWDFQVVREINVAPASITVSNLVPLVCFDIFKDGETSSETLTNIALTVQGAGNNATGRLYVYRDVNSVFSKDASETLVTNLFFTHNSPINIKLSETNIAKYGAATPTRFWIAAELFHTAGVFSNTLQFDISNVSGTGPNGGKFDNKDLLRFPNPDYAKIDSQKISISIHNLLTNGVKQGRSDVPLFALYVTNTDPDGIQYLGQLNITNFGTATFFDLGVLKLFSVPNDTVEFELPMGRSERASAFMKGTKDYELTLLNPYPIQSNHTFYVTVDIYPEATEHTTLSMGIVNSSNILFRNGYNSAVIENFSTAAKVTTTPGSFRTETNSIFHRDSDPFYDFFLVQVDNSLLPQAFTTNEIVPAISFDIYEDFENRKIQSIDRFDFRVSGANAANIRGITSVYKDFNNNGVFDPLFDALITNIPFAGSHFSIPTSISNLSLDSQNPNRFFLTIKATNNITTSKNAKIKFSLTNIVVSGVQNTISTLSLLGGETVLSQIDTHRVSISAISNLITTSSVRQGTFDNPFLYFTVQGTDNDENYYLSHVDVQTNSLFTALISDISLIKLFPDINLNRVVDPGLSAETTPIVSISPTTGLERLNLSPPLLLTGTNRYGFFISYDVSSANTNAIGKKIGLSMSNNSLGFRDPFPSDNWIQKVFAANGNFGDLSSPSNITIVAITAREWDMRVVNAKAIGPEAIFLSNEMAAVSFSLMRDGKDEFNETIESITVRSITDASDCEGIITIYRDLGTLQQLDGADTPLTNVKFSKNDLNSDFTIPWRENNISQSLLNPDRFLITVKVTNRADDHLVYDNKLALRVRALEVTGPNNGKLENAISLTNLSTPSTRIDAKQIFVSAISDFTNRIAQGTPNTCFLKLTFTNYDADAKFFLNTLKISNVFPDAADAYQSAVVYLDNGDGIFSNNDFIKANNTLSGNTFTLSFTPPLILTGKTNRLWVTAGISFTADTSKKVGLRIFNPTDNIIFTDGYVDDYVQTPTLTASSSPLPSAPREAQIITYTAIPEDFVLVGPVDYEVSPSSFTTNQEIPVAKFQIYMDRENNAFGNYMFSNVTLQLGGVGSEKRGIVSIFKESDGLPGFSASDISLRSIPFSGNGSLNLNFTDSAVSLDGSSPSTYYATVRVTNAINFLITNTLSTKVIALRGDGPNGGIFKNTNLLISGSSLTRLDSYRVQVVAISNTIANYTPQQGSFNNIYYKIILKNSDIDAVQQITSIRIMTNEFTTLSPGHIPYIKIFDKNDMPLTLNQFNNDNTITFNTPIALTGTNGVELNIKYDVTTDNNAIYKTFGLKIPNNGITFLNPNEKGFNQTPFIIGNIETLQTMTNVTIGPFFYQDWDFRMRAAGKVPMHSFDRDRVVPLAWFDIESDTQAPSLQFLTNLQIKLLGSTNMLAGEVSLYKDSGTLGFLAATNDTFVTSAPFTPSTAANLKLNFSQNMINTSSSIPPFTRYWIGVRVTNTINTVYNAKLGLKFLKLMGSGPDASSSNVSGASIFGYSILSNIDGSSVSEINHNKLTANVEHFTFTNNQIAQASFGMRALHFNLISDQLSETNYFKGLTLTNYGDAGSADIDRFDLYKITPASSTLVPSNRIGGGTFLGKTANIPLFNTLPISGLTNKFAITFDIKINANTNKTIRLGIVPGSILFEDIHNEEVGELTVLVDQAGRVTNTLAYTPTPTTSTIIMAGGDPTFDFSLELLDYSKIPTHFTTNQLIEMASFSIFKDIDPNVLTFDGIKGRVNNLTDTPFTPLAGRLYLYQETNAAGFQLTDKLLKEVPYLGTGTFAISNLNITDLTFNNTSPNIFYLMFKATNAIANSMNSSVGFVITNLSIYKTTNSVKIPGVLRNSSQLTTYSPVPARIDRYEIQTMFLSNIASKKYVEMGSLSQPLLHIGFKVPDKDAINRLHSLILTTNQNFTPSASLFSRFTLYNDTDSDRIFNPSKDTIIPSTYLFTNNTVVIRPNTPLTVPGTNVRSYFIAYNVANSLGAYTNKFSFKVTPNSIKGFEKAIVTGISSGPTAPLEQIVVFNGSKPWDFELFSAETKLPNRILPGEIYPAVNLKIYKDKQIPEWEVITNLTIYPRGTGLPLAGTIYLYTNSGVFNDTWAPYINKNTTFAAGTPISIRTALTNVSDNIALPTSLVIAVKITNNNTIIFNKNFGISVSNIQCLGPRSNGMIGGGIVSGLERLTNQLATLASIDSTKLHLNISNTLELEVKQGQFRIPALKFSFTNSDPDAPYYFKSVLVSNVGNASPTDIAKIYLYLDDGKTTDGNHLFDTFDDIPIASANMNANNSATLTPFLPARFTTSVSNLFWVVFDITQNAVINRTNRFVIPNASAIEVVSSDNPSLAKTITITNLFPLPLGGNFAKTTVGQNLPWDFSLDRIDYKSLPQFFTTNQMVPVSSFRLLADSFSNANQELTDVSLRINGASSSFNGIAYLYRELTNLGFNIGDDTEVTNVAIVNGNDLNFPISITDVDSAFGDTFYVAIKITNNITDIKNDVVSFQIYDIKASTNSADKGTIRYWERLESTFSAPARVDSPLVNVLYISNAISAFKPTQASFHNTYMKIALQSDDLDALHELISIDVVTNSLSINFTNDTVSSIRIYTNILANKKCDPETAIGSAFFTNGRTRVQFTTPLRITGSTPSVIYVGFDITDTNSVVEDIFGLTIPATPIAVGDVFGFRDPVNDNFQQYSIASYIPGPANPTNLFVEEFGAQEWDIFIEDVSVSTHSGLLAGNEYQLYSIRAYRENQKGTNLQEYVYGVSVTNLYNSTYYHGLLKYYRGIYDSDDFEDRGTLIASNFIHSTNNHSVIIFKTNTTETNELVISESPVFLDKFFITYTPIAFSNDSINRFSITKMFAGGYNGGNVENSSLLQKVAIAKLDKPALSFEVLAFGVSIVTQGVRNHPVVKFRFTSQDPDVNYNKKGFVLSIGGIYDKNEIAGARILRGTTSASTPVIDQLPEIGYGQFIDNQATIQYQNLESFTGTSPWYYLTIDGGTEIVDGHFFNLSIKHTNQIAIFNPIDNLTGYLAVFSNFITDDIQLYATIEFIENSDVAILNTILDRSKGDVTSIYLKPGTDFTKYSIEIFTLFGNKVRSIGFNSTEASWDGSNNQGLPLNSGMYMVIVNGPEKPITVKVYLKSGSNK